MNINRLSRIIDRSRLLEERLQTTQSERYLAELRVLHRRSTAIACSCWRWAA